MPLINCPDCNQKISDAAPSCPFCGRPQRNKLPLLASAFKNLTIAAACFGALYWLFSSAMPMENTSMSESDSGWPDGPTTAQFSKDYNAQRGSLCSAFIAPVGRDSPMLLVQKHNDQNLLHLKLRREEWAYPAGSWGTVSVEFAGGYHLTLKAYRSGKVMDATIPATETSSFAAALRESSWLMIALAGDPEPSWKVSLAGVPATMVKLNKCALEQISESGARR